MKCPLFRLANLISEFDSNWDGDDCLQEECAWWDCVGRSCILVAIYRELRLLVGAAGMAADKLSPTKE